MKLKPKKNTIKQFNAFNKRIHLQVGVFDAC